MKRLTIVPSPQVAVQSGVKKSPKMLFLGSSVPFHYMWESIAVEEAAFQQVTSEARRVMAPARGLYSICGKAGSK